MFGDESNDQEKNRPYTCLCPISTPPPLGSPPAWVNIFCPLSGSPAHLPPEPRTFEETLWIPRFYNLDDARRLDIAKRILLDKKKIIESKHNVPNEIIQCIQDHILGNHWYDLYKSKYHDDANGNSGRNTPSTHIIWYYLP